MTTLMVLHGHLIVVDGKLATAQECCCGSCDCSGDNQPTNFSASWAGVEFSGEVEVDNATNCAFWGCDREVYDIIEVMQDSWTQGWCDEMLFGNIDSPKDELGWPLPVEGGLSNPHCGEEDAEIKFMIVFRERYKVKAVAYQGEAYNILWSATLAGNTIHIQATVECRFYYTHAEAFATERQYRYVYNTLPAGECGTSVRPIFYSHYGTWTDVAEEIDWNDLTFLIPVYAYANLTNPCLLPSNLNFPQPWTNRGPTGDTAGIVTKQGDVCLYLTYAGEGDIECPCEEFYDVPWYEATSPLDYFLAWYQLQNRVRGMFDQVSYDHFDVCGNSVFTTLNELFDIQPTPGGTMYPYYDYDETCSLSFETTTIVDGEPVTVPGGGPAPIAQYEKFIPCDELIGEAIVLDLVSASDPGVTRVILNIPHDLPCNGIDETHVPQDVGVPYPIIPETMTITFTRVEP
jgi:hypothetical protein